MAMIRKHQILVGILSAAWIGCGPAAPPESSTPEGSTSICESSQEPGRTVVGCGLAPDSAVLGADDQAIYVVNANSTWFRIERDSGRPTQLYHSLSSGMSSASSQLFRTSFVDGKIYLLDSFIKDGAGYHGIMTLSTRTPGNPTLALGVFQEQGSVFVISDGYAYFRDRWNKPSRVPTPLVRAPLSGGATEVLYTREEVTPFAVRGGYVYFLTLNNGIARVPVTGGAETLILPKLPASPEPSHYWITYRDLAVDDQYVYVPYPSIDGRMPHTIRRFSATGGDSGTIVANITWHPELPVRPATWLRLDGEYLYFVVETGIYRVKPGGDTQPQSVGSSRTPPIFDANSIYGTDQIGGYDSPLEGVILKFPKERPRPAG